MSIEFKTCIIHGKSKLYTCKEPEYDRSPLMIRLLLCPSFLLAESTPFHNSQECHMPCFASPLASILLNSFRVQTF